jgi:hypothetical protein
MEDLDTRQREYRQKAIDELRSNKMGILLRIIDELEAMDLSTLEIETVFQACGLNDDYAIRFGSLMRAEKD